MTHFFIEFRFQGYTKHHLRELMREVARKFRVRGAVKERPVPHMALFYGSPGMTDIKKVCTAVEKVGKRYTLVPFKIEGFDWRNGEKGKVVAADITASPELKKLRTELVGELSKICTPHRFDTQSDFWFHTTIAFKDIDRKFDRIWNYVNTKERPSINQYLVRITVLNENSKIVGEYDLILKRWLYRWQVIPPYGWYWWRKTMNKLRELRGLSTRPRRLFWRAAINFIRSLWGKKQIYLIGDTHFDHDNIIRFCNRPFQSAREMNAALVTNWNGVVGQRDIVYFLGDWASGRRHKPAVYWIKKLKGCIISVRGRHDNDAKGVMMSRSKTLRYKGYDFLLVHDPERRSTPWHGWVIHGHKHNNNMRDYPFINGERKTINVSVELIGYKPVSIDNLISLGLDSIRRMRTIDSQPERW